MSTAAQQEDQGSGTRATGRRFQKGSPRPEALPVIEASRKVAGSLDVPVVLPGGLTTLSASSILRFERCRESFLRHQIKRERELTNARMAMGTAVSNAVTSHLIARRDDRDPGIDRFVERAMAELKSELREAVCTARERKASEEAVRSGVEAYAEEVVPLLDEADLEVLAVEREVRFRFPNTEWSVLGYIDIETSGPVIDVKFGKKHKSEAEAHFGLQASLYILARFLEGSDPSAGFVFHSGRTTKPKEGGRWRVVPEDAPSPRTEIQLEALMGHIAHVAREIATCAETGDWGYSTEGWWCSPNVCPFHSSCPAGGLR